MVIIHWDKDTFDFHKNRNIFGSEDYCAIRKKKRYNKSVRGSKKLYDIEFYEKPSEVVRLPKVDVGFGRWFVRVWIMVPIIFLIIEYIWLKQFIYYINFLIYGLKPEFVFIHKRVRKEKYVDPRVVYYRKTKKRIQENIKYYYIEIKRIIKIIVEFLKNLNKDLKERVNEIKFKKYFNKFKLFLKIEYEYRVYRLYRYFERGPRKKILQPVKKFRVFNKEHKRKQKNVFKYKKRCKKKKYYRYYSKRKSFFRKFRNRMYDNSKEVGNQAII